MILKNTLENIKKTKHSFFNTKSGDVVWFDIYKENLICYLDGDSFSILKKDAKKINKHFIDWGKKYNNHVTKKIIETINYNFWIPINDYDIPFNKIGVDKYYNNNFTTKGLIKIF